MMKRALIRTGLLVLALIAGAPSCQSQNTSPNSSLLQPCTVPQIKDKALCGNLEVFENRVTRKGRKINLKIIVLPATGNDRAPDPLFYLAGGPGASATEDAPGVAQIFAKIHERRDLVFLDQRGAGGSHPLNCAFFNPDDPQSYFGYFFPLAEVKKCRRELEATSDLLLYTTPVAADDLDEVRTALGYEKINLFGGSYGTRAALVYLRQHPEHVRTVTLQGVAPTNQFMPYDFPLGTEHALQGVIEECAADEACHRAFPDLKTDEQK